MNIIDLLNNNGLEFNNKTINIEELKIQIEDLNVRELYTIDKKYCFDISSFIIKKNCILIKFDFIRCIIFKDKVYILDIDNNEVKKITKRLKKTMETYDKKKIFHIHVIDILFTEICDHFYSIIQMITEEISLNNENIKNGNYNYLHFTVLQSNLVNLEYKIRELKNIAEDLTNNTQV
jgi:hypothetical protein